MNALNPCNTSHSFGCNLQNTAQKQALRCSCPCKRPQTRQRRHAAVQASSAIHENIPAELTKIVAGFQMVPDPKVKYQQLLFYAKKLKPMAAALHTDDNKVQGCVSQVWVHPHIQDGKVFWEADSDSALTKGLAALLVQGMSGSTAADIVAIPPDFIDRLGLQQSLTPSRNNGFLNMFRLMQRKSLEIVQQEAHGPEGAAEMAKPVPADEVNEQPVEGSYQVLKEQEVQEDKQAQRMAQQADRQTPDATLPTKS